MLEDNPLDAELSIGQLTAAGYVCDVERVQTRDEFLVKLNDPDFDLILADYNLPTFDGASALKITVEKGIAIPFILVSGAIGEEAAIDILKAGATDYVIKGHLFRLAPVVQRALEEREEHERRQRAEISLIESEKRYRMLFEKAKDAIVILQAEGEAAGKIINANQAAADMHGFELPELLTLNMAALNPPKDLSLYQERVQKILSGHWINAEITHLKKDGSGFPLEISAGLYEVDSEKFILAFYRDITERRTKENEAKLLEDQIRQAQKMEALGTIAGGIAHDFNNILFPIVGYTELSLLEIPQDHSVRQNLMEVLQAAQRAQALVKQILAFSRQREDEQRPIQINMIIKEVVKLLRSVLPSTIKIDQNIEDGDSIIIADPVQIHQIIMNLCINAYHAMEGKVGILGIQLQNAEFAREQVLLDSSLLPGPYVRLRITDNGCGMDEIDLQKIFDPFFTTKKKGTGLGLSTVKSIVHGLNGGITIKSQPNEGTRFDVYLPRTKKEALSTDYKPPEPIVAGDEHILIVDDEVEIARMVEKALKRWGYRVTQTSRSTEALALFEKDPDIFDLVITDLTMPDMTGMQLAKHINDIRTNIPIILCTGFTETVSKEELSAIGIHKLVIKPIVMNELAAFVREALEEIKAADRASVDR